MSDKEVIEQYENFWKEIIETSDGEIDRLKLANELYDFSILTDNLSKIYCYMTGNMVSKPMVDASVIIQLCEEQLTESYERGYNDAKQDLGEINEKSK